MTRREDVINAAEGLLGTAKDVLALVDTASTNEETAPLAAVARGVAHAFVTVADVAAGLAKEVDDLTTERDRLRAIGDSLQRNVDLANASAHVIIEHGVIPGFDDSCRCEECRLVAKAMDEAGYLDRVVGRWWDTDTAEEPDE